MSFFSFRNQNQFKDIAKILASNEQTSRAALHEKHPHTKNIFDRHNIDLREVRRKGARTAAAATVLGAFLAFPHLLGNPAMQDSKPEQNTQGVNIEKQVDRTRGQHSGQPNSTASNSSSSNIEANQPLADNQAKKSQGHIHGRSYLAPPKEHGFHDLGLHRGEDKGKGSAEAPGPHPEELEVHRGGSN